MKSSLAFDIPALKPLGKGLWSLVFDWVLVFRGEYYCIRSGFVTDGASIPRALWLVCGSPLSLPRLFAAIVHDYLYSGGDPEATRADADDLYRDIQIALGVPRWKAYVEWAALRIFGKSHWQTNKQKKGQEMKKTLALAAVAASLLTVLSGCGKSVDVEGKGMYANANSGVVGIGAFEVVTVPEGHDAARIEYSEDTAWLSPSTKTHAFKINLSGSNSVEQVSNIVANICAAFIATAPAIAAANASAVASTNAVSSSGSALASSSASPSSSSSSSLSEGAASAAQTNAVSSVQQ